MNTKTARATTIQIPNTLTETSVSELSRRVKDILNDKPDCITLDCSLLNNVISGHIWCIWEAYLACQKADAILKLSSPTYGLTRVLRILDLYDFFAQEIIGFETWTKAETKSLSPEKLATHLDEFLPRPEQVERALDRFMKFLSQAGVSSIHAFDMKTVFYEVTNNIMTHSSMDIRESVVFTADLSESAITLVFMDSGNPFDPTQIPDTYDPKKVQKNKQTRGYGLTMIRRLTDKVQYNRKAGILNILVIEKSWRQINEQ